MVSKIDLELSQVQLDIRIKALGTQIETKLILIAIPIRN